MTPPQRIQRRRVRGWRLPPGAICVTRPGPFGNPWKVTAGCKAAEAVRKFADWLSGDGADVLRGRRRLILARLPELRGNDLACWCRPDSPCHADVLLEMANR